MNRRKTVVFLAAFGTLILALSSCGKSACKPVEFDKNLKCHADITEGDAAYSADLERADGAGWKAVFTAPETIEGMEVILSDDNCTINFKELSCSLSKDELPQFGMIDLVTQALDECADKKVTKCVEKDNVITQQGEINGLSFNAEFQGKKLHSLSIGDKLNVEFS